VDVGLEVGSSVGLEEVGAADDGFLVGSFEVDVGPSVGPDVGPSLGLAAVGPSLIVLVGASDTCVGIDVAGDPDGVSVGRTVGPSLGITEVGLPEVHVGLGVGSGVGSGGRRINIRRELLRSVKKVGVVEAISKSDKIIVVVTICMRIMCDADNRMIQ
jgi:hypothetical protein